MNLLWPGDHRAGDTLDDGALLRAMVQIEAAWLRALVEVGIAPSTASDPLQDLIDEPDLPSLIEKSEVGGNPVIPLVELLRERVKSRNVDAGRWLHRGLTSQDVLDTALVKELRDAMADIRTSLLDQIRVLAGLVSAHRDTEMAGRTLTQYALPTTFGLVSAGWLHGVLDAHDSILRLTYAAQLGGAVGTRAATVELAAGHIDPVGTANAAAFQAATSLGLSSVAPWHTRRTTFTRIADSSAACNDAWGAIARDVLHLARPEVKELEIGAVGGSSTMPDKRNPTLAILIRRTALGAPALTATLHTAAANQVDQRADGAWHLEWDTLRTLVRRTLIAARQMTELVRTVRPDPEQMAKNLKTASVGGEQQQMAELTDRVPGPTYLGAAAHFIDQALLRAAPIAGVKA